MARKREQAGIPAAEAVDLQGLVRYGDGSIVSRTLADSDAGTLTLFAFDAGEGLSEHSAPYDAYVQVLSGEAELTIGGAKVRVGAGQMALMPADVPHAVDAAEQFKMLLIMLRPE